MSGWSEHKGKSNAGKSSLGQPDNLSSTTICYNSRKFLFPTWATVNFSYSSLHPKMPPTNYVGYTAPINPPSAEPKLTESQIWALLRRKIRRAEDFVGGAILNTEVLSEAKDAQDRPVTTRMVTFREGNRRVEEVVTTFYPVKVEFQQPEGSHIANIVSRGPDDELFLTYTFNWVHPGLDDAALAEKRVVEQNMAKHSVESTISAMRAMVSDGRWEETV